MTSVHRNTSFQFQLETVRKISGSLGVVKVVLADAFSYGVYVQHHCGVFFDE